MNEIAPTPEGTWPREILVLKRATGYLRLHLPPLLYAPALAIKLERALLRLRGVRRVDADRHRARLSVYYDPWLTDDRPILHEIDRQGTPLMEKMQPEAFTTALVEQRSVRRAELAERGTRVAYLGLLGWVHVWVFRAAIRHPIRLWWVWALLGFGIWTHRRQIRSIKLLPGGDAT
jgi:hypothetical protein